MHRASYSVVLISIVFRLLYSEELLCGSSKLLDVLASHIDPENAFPCESKGKCYFNYLIAYFKSLSPHYKGILLGIVECQRQLKNSSCSDDFDYSQAVRAAFDALVSAIYNFSRKEEMRMEIGTCS